MRISVNLDENLVEEIDKKAKKLHVSRSAYIALSVSRQMQIDDMTDNLPNIVELFNRIEDLELKKIVNEQK